MMIRRVSIFVLSLAWGIFFYFLITTDIADKLDSAGDISMFLFLIPIGAALLSIQYRLKLEKGEVTDEERHTIYFLWGIGGFLVIPGLILPFRRIRENKKQSLKEQKPTASQPKTKVVSPVKRTSTAKSPPKQDASCEKRKGIGVLMEQRGLRPMGNKKRLMFADGRPCMMYAAIFRERSKAEQYSRLMANYALKNPPPFLIETMVAFAPKTLYNEKFAFICPYPGNDNPVYKEWAQNAMRTCNDTLRQDNYFSGYGYDAVIPNLDSIISWDILLPRDFDINSSIARELLNDPQDGGFKAVKMASENGAATPTTPNPQGPWVGILIELTYFLEWTKEESLAGKNKTAELLKILGDGKLTSCTVHGTTYVSDDRYWCLAIHTADSGQAKLIEELLRTKVGQCRALKGARVLAEAQIPSLPYNGYVSRDGAYFGN